MIARLTEAWKQIGEKERRLVVLGLAVLLPVALYLYGWQPLMAERARLATTVERLRGDLAVVRAGAVEAGRLQSLSSIAASGSLRALAETAAARFRLDGSMSVRDSQGADQLTVAFEHVPFNEWLRWAGELGTQGVSVSACQIESLGTAGVVRVSVSLKRAAVR